MSTSVIYTRIGENRGTLRLYVEGQKLARSGVNPGDRYEIAGDGQVIRLVFRPDGTHIVSRRSRGEKVLPVIDICARRLADRFAANDRVRVVVKDGQIEVTLHHFERARIDREARITTAVRTGQPIKIGSLAHGGGVLDLAIHQGLADAGIGSTLSFANEIEDSYLEASMSNNPVWSEDTIALHGSMQEIEWRQLPRIDLLVAGIPCTGASVAGRAKNKLKQAEDHDTAGALFTAFLDAVSILRPSLVLLENVVPYASTASMSVIRSVLTTLGYDIQETVLEGPDFGAIENRKRLCMVASSRGISMSSIESIEKSPNPSHRVGDYLEDVPLDDPSWREYRYLADKEVRDIAAGKGFRRQIVSPDSPAIGTVGAGYAKARSSEPFLAHPHHEGVSRLFTPAEHARFKTIPERLIQEVSATTAHEILGQSVIWNAFRAVGYWLGSSLTQQLQMAPRQAIAA